MIIVKFLAYYKLLGSLWFLKIRLVRGEINNCFPTRPSAHTTKRGRGFFNALDLSHVLKSSEDPLLIPLVFLPHVPYIENPPDRQSLVLCARPFTRV